MKYLLVLLLLLLTGCNSSQEEIDSEIIADSYVYSQEEVAEFITDAQAQLDKALRYSDIEPGYDIYSYKRKDEEFEIMKTMPGVESAVLDDGSAYIIKVDGELFPFNIGFLDIDSINKVPYRVDKLTFSKAFNNDLSLKIADAFYGYTGVGDPFYYKIINRNDYIKYKSAIDYVNNVQNVKRMPSFFNKLDEMYKDSNGELVEIINDYQYWNDIVSKGEYGGTKLFREIYRDYSSDNSCNPLQTFLASRYDCSTNLAMTLEDIFNQNNFFTYEEDMFLDKYNYYKENSNYYLFYYPIAVTRTGEKTFLVDIETSLPVTDYTAEIIYYQIETKFNQTYTFMNNTYALEKEKYPEKMDIIVRLNNNDLNKGMVLERYMSSVLYPELATDYTMKHDTNIYDSYLRCNYTDRQEIPWYPNEEAQMLLKAYFTCAKEAYDNNTYFSFTETIKKVADELDFDFKEAESIVYSYYLICNGSRIQ